MRAIRSRPGERIAVLAVCAAAGIAYLVIGASASTGNVLAVVLVVAFMWALAAGSDYATPLGGLCAVAGATFIIASIWHSRRG